jgi:hypothetical protein
MRVPAFFSSEDPAHRVLVPYLRESERLLQNAVTQIDPSGDAQITLAADLSFPHDVMRLCGGFATGIFVEWRCDVPFLPVDIAMNVDVSSVFLLHDDWASQLGAHDFQRLRETFASSSYVFNFHKGNHFISAGLSELEGPVLVVHSNEKEFKFQSNGLVPVAGNWFADKVQEARADGRRLRYLSGEPAARVIALARSLNEYSIERHRFVASVLGKFAGWRDESHDIHYFMPTPQSACLGSFLCQPGDVVPIFSAPGCPIDLFQVEAGGENMVRSINADHAWLLVPHGWGKTALADTEIRVQSDGCAIDNRWYVAEPQVSLGKDPGLVKRLFATDPASPDSMASCMKQHCPGQVVGQIRQLVSYSREGFCRHLNDVASI